MGSIGASIGTSSIFFSDSLLEAEEELGAVSEGSGGGGSVVDVGAADSELGDARAGVSEDLEVGEVLEVADCTVAAGTGPGVVGAGESAVAKACVINSRNTNAGSHLVSFRGAFPTEARRRIAPANLLSPHLLDLVQNYQCMSTTMQNLSRENTRERC